MILEAGILFHGPGLAAHGGMARFGNDDGYLVGPANVVFPALDIFARNVRDKCLLHLQVSKTEVFSWDGVLPPQAPQDMKVAGAQVGEEWQPGFVCYGIPVGTPAYEKHSFICLFPPYMRCLIRYTVGGKTRDDTTKNTGKFQLAPVGVLAPGSAHARPSARPPIDMS